MFTNPRLTIYKKNMYMLEIHRNIDELFDSMIKCASEFHLIVHPMAESYNLFPFWYISNANNVLFDHPRKINPNRNDQYIFHNFLSFNASN